MGVVVVAMALVRAWFGTRNDFPITFWVTKKKNQDGGTFQ
jgi:hypothetical protein